MAFGGVATGSIKANVAAIATGIVNSITFAPEYPRPALTPAMTGKKAAAVAVFDVISVRKMTSVTTAMMIAAIGSAPSAET